MHILFLLRYYPIYGGGETVTLQLANEFVKRGKKVTILYLWESDRKDVYVSKDITALKVEPMHNPIDKEVINSSDLKVMESYLYDVIRKYNPDIIINQWWPVEVVYNANKGICKIVKCHHTAIIMDTPKKRLLKKLLPVFCYNYLINYKTRKEYNNTLKYSDKWVFLCDEHRKEIINVFGKRVDVAKLEVIPNPCRYKQNYKALLTKKKKVLFVGRIAKVKNVEYILDVWKNIERFVADNNWQLDIVGDGELFEQCNKKITQENIKNVKMFGSADPLPFFEEASILIMASLNEGFPVVLNEAMCNGCVPIVRDSFSSLKNIVENNYNGIIFDNDCSSELIALMNNTKIRKELAENAILSSKRYNIDVIYDKWNDLFSSLQ